MKAFHSRATASGARPAARTASASCSVAVHGAVQPLANPAFEGQDEALLFPFEEGGSSPAQPGASQRCLAADGLEAPAVGQPHHRRQQRLVHQRQPLFNGRGHAGRVVVAQQALGQKDALFQQTQVGQVRASGHFGQKPRARLLGKAVPEGGGTPPSSCSWKSGRKRA